MSKSSYLSPSIEDASYKNKFIVSVGFGNHIKKYEARDTLFGPHVLPVICDKKKHDSCGVGDYLGKVYNLNFKQDRILNSRTEGSTIILTMAPYFGNANSLYTHFDSLIAHKVFDFIDHVTGLKIEEIPL